MLTQESRAPFKRGFAVVTAGRTGSHFLLSLLNSHWRILHHGEIFGEDRLRQPHIQQQIRENGPLGYAERFLKGKFLRTTGIKIMYHHFDPAYAEAIGVGQLQEFVDYIRNNTGFKIIHLKRRNHLRTLISVEVAKMTKQYSLLDETQRIADVSIELQAEYCIRSFEWFSSKEKEFDVFFQHHPCLDVFYEDLAAKRKNECNRILRFLGVSRRRLKTNFLKQNTRPLSQTIQNYHQLKEQLASTEWAHFFDEPLMTENDRQQESAQS